MSGTDVTITTFILTEGKYDKYVVGEVADDGGVEGGARERFQQEDCDGAVLGDLEEVYYSCGSRGQKGLSLCGNASGEVVATITM
ncbi:hypothetical protein FF2_024867 [Malus domestica]